MASFQDILNTPASEVEAPKALPVGTYLCIVDGPGEFTKIGKNNTDCINFNLKPLQAQPDVDQQSLLETLNGSSLADRKIRHRLFVTQDAAWRLKKFLVEDLGILEGNKSLGELIPEAPGRQVLVSVGHRASDDGSQIYMDIKNTAKV